MCPAAGTTVKRILAGRDADSRNATIITRVKFWTGKWIGKA
jgi:hypothetical protein